VPCEPGDHINVLFSSGTTGEPKAIPWTHSAAIKAASDGHYHHDIHPSDTVVWPTNLGWMMGPWLILATLINRATIGLYDDAPTTAGFARFIDEAGVAILGCGRVSRLVGDKALQLDW
jgi:acetyl-CoA synthetase